MWDYEILIFVLLFVCCVYLMIRFDKVPPFLRRLKYVIYSPNYYEAKLVREILERKSVFFKSLSAKGKNHMIKKSLRFMMSKRFVGMEGLEVTDEMIAEISGTAAQLTFGLKESGFSHFHTVKIFPETFYSRLFDRHLKGGASVGGVLFFSWEDFQNGFADSTDKYNLGLHEMAHALLLNLRYGNKFDRWFADYTDEWMKVAGTEFQKMNHGNPSFLRDYAATNMEEFFSVCVEHFFEVPEEFKVNLPDIYNHLCYLLRLDPTNKNNDYKLDQLFIDKINRDISNAPIPGKLPRAYAYDSWHWSFNFIIVGLFVGLPLMIVMYAYVMVEITFLLVWCGIITYFVFQFRQFFDKKGIYLIRHLIMFAIFGVAFNVGGVALTINRFFNEDKKTYSYFITHYKIRKLSPGKSEVTFILNENAYEHHARARKLIYSGPDDYFRTARELILTTTTGTLGFENIEMRQLIIENDTIVISNREF